MNYQWKQLVNDFFTMQMTNMAAKKYERMAEEARQLALGRRQVASDIGHQMRHPVDRVLDLVNTGSFGRRIVSKDVVKGWILCERLTTAVHKQDVRGLMLATTDDIYAYDAQSTHDTYSWETDYLMDAWGYKESSLTTRNGRHLACDKVEKIDLFGEPTDLEIKLHSYAGSLALEDLFAGLIVWNNINIDQPAEIVIS